eukprot:410621-Rhodomonas_salina.2
MKCRDLSLRVATPPHAPPPPRPLAVPASFFSPPTHALQPQLEQQPPLPVPHLPSAPPPPPHGDNLRPLVSSRLPSPPASPAIGSRTSLQPP